MKRDGQKKEKTRSARGSYSEDENITTSLTAAEIPIQHNYEEDDSEEDYGIRYVCTECKMEYKARYCLKKHLMDIHQIDIQTLNEDDIIKTITNCEVSSSAESELEVIPNKKKMKKKNKTTFDQHYEDQYPATSQVSRKSLNKHLESDVEEIKIKNEIVIDSDYEDFYRDKPPEMHIGGIEEDSYVVDGDEGTADIDDDNDTFPWVNEKKLTFCYRNAFKKLGPDYYICLKCTKTERTFGTQISLRSHIRSHHFGMRFVCRICKNVYRNRKNINDHLKGKHDISTPLRQDNIIIKRLTKSEIREQERLFDKTLPDNEDYSQEGKTLSLPAEAVELLNSDRNRKKYPFSYKSFYKKSGDFYVCLKCGPNSKKFANISTVYVHIRCEHYGIKYKCTECNYEYKNRPGLKRHLMNNHHIDIRTLKTQNLFKKKTITGSSAALEIECHQEELYRDMRNRGKKKKPKLFKKLGENNFICTKCPNSKHFYNRNSMYYHKKTYHNAKKLALTRRHPPSSEVQVKQENLGVVNNVSDDEPLVDVLVKQEPEIQYDDPATAEFSAQNDLDLNTEKEFHSQHPKQKFHHNAQDDSENECSQIDEQTNIKSEENFCTDEGTPLPLDVLINHETNFQNPETHEELPLQSSYQHNAPAFIAKVNNQNENTLENLDTLYFGNSYKKVEYYYICLICNEKFIHNAAVLYHLRSKHFGITYKCNHCDKEYKSKSGLDNHKRRYHQAKPIRLQRQTSEKTVFYRNCYKKLGEQHYICLVCPNSKKFTNRLALYGHIRCNHYGLKYICTICKNEYKDKHGLKTHLLEKHQIDISEFKSQDIIRKMKSDHASNNSYTESDFEASLHHEQLEETVNISSDDDAEAIYGF